MILLPALRVPDTALRVCVMQTLTGGACALRHVQGGNPDV